MKIQDLNSELELKNESELKSESIVKKTPEKTIPEMNELPEARGVNSHTFCRKRGTYETRYYDRPIHYGDNDAEYEKIGNALTDAEDGCTSENCMHPFHARFYRQDDTPALFSLEKGVHQLTVSVQGKFGSPAIRPVPATNQNAGTMLYRDVTPGTDYDSGLTPDGVKIGITVKKPGSPDRYAFRLSGENLSATWNGQKTVQFFADPSDEPVFEIPAPFLTDAGGAYAECISFEVIPNGDNETVLTVIPDYGWMLAKERVYPVRMEWTVRCGTHQSSGFCFDGQSLSADGKVAIGGTETRFRMQLPEKKSGMITRKVCALFRCDAVPLADEKTYLLALKRETEDADSQLLGYCAMRLGQEEYAFDVTSEYEANPDTTYALQLCEEKDGELIGVTDSAVAVLQVSGNDAVATFAVTETDGTADTDKESSGESGNIGSVGTYEVDLVTGKLNLEMKDFAWEGNRMPVSISRSFKGQYAKQDYSTWKASTTGCFANMRLGYGWHMNLMQSMMAVGDNYVYTDDAGEETVLKPCQCESGTACCDQYEDDSGLGYVFNAQTGELKKGDELYKFSAGRLIQMKDRFENTLSIHYNNGRITSVVDGVGRTFTFGYSGNYLISITAPNGSSIQYQYCNGNLCCTTYPNGQMLTFAYDTSDNQPSAVTVSGSGISALTTQFAYNGTKVMQISTAANRVTAEKRTEFDIDSNGKQTIVTEIDGIDGANDQIKQHKVYFHEHSDKNYTYYEAGSENKIAVSGSNGVILPYTEPGMEIGNLTCKNLLKNHNFNTGITDPVSFGWSTNLTENYRDVQYDPPEKMPGYCAAYLLSLYSTDSQRGIWQTVNLTAGQSYVFSCYLKLAQGNSNPARGVYLMVKSANGTTTYRSQMITTKKEFQRVALPFTVDSSCGLSYTVGIYIDGNVKAKAIAPQLEQGTTLSPYNYLASNVVTKYASGSTSCPNSVHVADVKVPAAKDARETFTLSGYAQGGMSYTTTEGQETYAALKAVIYYQQTSEERRNGTYPTSKEFWVPIYTESGKQRFAMVQFSKDQYRAIDYIKITCENNYNSYGVTFSDLQLVRNTYVDGLTEEDFIGNTDDSAETDTEAENSLLTSSVTDSDEDEVETIPFEEVLDSFGNTLTGTNFKNGEFGAIYTEQMFADSNPNDTIGDAGNNKTSEIDARGNETKYEYDPVTSKPTKVIDRCGNATSYTYDAAGRTTKVTAPNGGTVNYGYNSYDDLTAITRGDGQSYTMGYDAYRNLTSVKVGSQNLVTYDYKTGGNRLKSMTYANGAVQNLTYDRLGNVIGEAWNGVMAYRYFYDASNQLIKTLDISNKKMYNMNRVGENVTSVEEYDVTSINASTYTVSGLTLVGTMYYSFDSNGKQFRKKYIDADGNEQKYVFEYRDEQNVAVQLPTGVVSHAKSDHLGRKVFDELQLGKGLMNRTFTYHDGEITQTHLDNDKQVSKPETTLVKQIAFADGRTISYEYDKEERITKVTDSVDGVTEYTYDALGQLLTETTDGRPGNTMTYDQYGNIRSKNGVAYGYNTDGSNCHWKDLLTGYGSKSIDYDANGNPTAYLGHTLTWEKGRQLKSFGANSYKYNNDGIRIQKRTADKIHDYILDGTNIIKEIVTDTCNCPKYVNEYLYDLDGTVCGIKHNDTAYYFYKNLQGDIIAITDDTGATVARYTYDAWGKCTIVSDTSGVGIATINPFRYRSYYYDTETKLYYLQSRYYDPEVGRFINADEFDFGVTQTYNNKNLFVYCENNVVNTSDATGKLSLKGIMNFIEGFMKAIKKIVGWLKKIVKEVLKLYAGLDWKDISAIAKDINRSPHRVRQSIEKITKKLTQIQNKIAKVAIGVAILTVIATIGKKMVLLGNMTKVIVACAVEMCVSLIESLGEKILKPLLKLIPCLGLVLSVFAGKIVKLIMKIFLPDKKISAIKEKMESMIRPTTYKVDDYFSSFFKLIA